MHRQCVSNAHTADAKHCRILCDFTTALVSIIAQQGVDVYWNGNQQPLQG
ncbi:MAG: hypothetical protein OXI43_18885 [Candidatus Poribacteria bacterium]|nr:hypothetical protein [Candidatus Poribacteria bacterium]